MNCIITCKRPPEQHENVVLEFRTQQGDDIEWKGKTYRVQEIAIVSQDPSTVELKCTILKPKSNKPLVSIIS